MQGRTLTCVVLLAATAMIALGQERSSERPFEWRTSGETIEELKVEFKLNIELDQSSPDAVVTSYALLIDSRTATLAAERELNARTNELVAKAIAPIEAKLATAESLEAKAKHREQEQRDIVEMNYQSDGMRIIETEQTDDGAVFVVTAQKSTFRARAWDRETGGATGDWEDREFENFTRFRCVKQADGKWYIDRLETRATDWAAMREAGDSETEIYTWNETDPGHVSWAQARNTPAFPVAELKQDTPENAALALFNHLIPTYLNHTNRTYASNRTEWAAAIKSISTDRLRNHDAGKREMRERTLLSVTDGEDGIKVVQFAASTNFRGPMELHLRKDGDVWKIVRGGTYTLKRVDGERVPDKFVEEPNLISLNWR
jgi:hypothetical protein